MSDTAVFLLALLFGVLLTVTCGLVTHPRLFALIYVTPVLVLVRFVDKLTHGNMYAAVIKLLTSRKS